MRGRRSPLLPSSAWCFKLQHIAGAQLCVVKPPSSRSAPRPSRSAANTQLVSVAATPPAVHGVPRRGAAGVLQHTEGQDASGRKGSGAGP